MSGGMAADHPSPEPQKPIRASRWKQPPAPRARSNRLLFRLIAIPALAFAGVLIYRGVQDRFVLPACDSARAKSTLANVLDQFKVGPVGDEQIKTLSTDKTKVDCNALVPLSNGGTLNVDYNFFWQGNNAEMRYAISRRGVNSPNPPPSGPQQAPQAPMRTN
jgi:hypothetical protein